LTSSNTSTAPSLSIERKTEGVFSELKHIQRIYGFLPSNQLKQVAERRGIDVRDVYTVASFYPHFNLKKPAKVNVRVCTDMSCHLRASDSLYESIKQRFRTASDIDFSLQPASCFGRCDRAPAIAINDNFHEGVTASSAGDLIDHALIGHAPDPNTEAVTTPRLLTDCYDGARPYQVLQNLLSDPRWEDAIGVLRESGLRGMGGAGFPTGMKWEAVRNADSDEKFIICNADESEPGTIKDRFIMSHLPHLVIEGMIVAGLITGAKKGIIYIRHEYEQQEEVLQKEIERCYEKKILGPNILVSGLQFELSIFVSPGGYICGEETALLEALEGKRSEPRNKPPFPVMHGLWNKPTVINNVETFAFSTAILAKGAAWFKSFGKNGAFGLKFVGVSGDVINPGVFEVPMGTTYSELVHDYAGGPPAGKKVIGYAPSGPSSGYLPASMLNLPLDWNAVSKAGSMVGSGAIVVCAEGTCMLDMALNSVKFYRNESCGKCVPCRIGSQKLVEMLTSWTQGKFLASDMALLDELSHTLRQTSICGLGQILPAPIQSVIKHFRSEIDRHLLHQSCPAGVCFQGNKA
jgi:NADH:ubiquinone oxidoreductase subunit F (NADH-binding)/NADH:ubiquinone oxidoreductase subunit E